MKEYTELEKGNIWVKTPEFIKIEFERIEDKAWKWFCISIGLIEIIIVSTLCLLLWAIK